MVAGLASRWLISRRVKNSCRTGARSLIAVLLPGGAGRGQLHQLGDGGDVPVGALGADVAEVSRQGRHRRGDVLAGPVPLQQGGDGKTVPQIVDPRPALDARGGAGLAEGGKGRALAERRALT